MLLMLLLKMYLKCNIFLPLPLLPPWFLPQCSLTSLLHHLLSGLCFHTSPPNIHSQHRNQSDPFEKEILSLFCWKLSTLLQHHSLGKSQSPSMVHKVPLNWPPPLPLWLISSYSPPRSLERPSHTDLHSLLFFFNPPSILPPQSLYASCSLCLE